MGLTREQLKNFIPSYRAGYLSAGGPNDTQTDDEVVQKMEEAEVFNESLAEQAGRKNGFEERNNYDPAKAQKP